MQTVEIKKKFKTGTKYRKSSEALWSIDFRKSSAVSAIVLAASLQIELEDEAENLEFEEEHLLGSKPMQIDVLVVKKLKDIPIRKNIGRIFRKHNIVEYKSPEDTFSLNDFYKVYGYACFYQSDTEHVGEILPEELTITIVCNRYPRKLIKHLQQSRCMEVKKKGKGIYYLTGDPIPIQMLITKELSMEENLWIRSLRTDVKSEKEINCILKEYEKHRNLNRYEAAMDAITRGNAERIREVQGMSNLIRILYEEEFEELEKKKAEEIEKAEKEMEKEMEKKNAEVMRRVELEKERFMKLSRLLLQSGKSEMLLRATTDSVYCSELYKEYGV
ncbi:3-isopropylmalate dehydrogenase [Hespellia stercorisuis]|uniref:Uncharacterized protein n=1 Tax=Hespellia stercorisuis DSM 15480 TaxID=1121950 RepID=A0A1M6TUH0_9FIRM|nr:3-isopropylmalate dehydrogenase [Hespellia stercorisuis]SHK60642.1 hypothetical protein SAMN02745243_03328 [Hespellia stercorisuis DSM 15480]